MSATSATYILRFWLLLALFGLVTAQYTSFSECLKICVNSSVTDDCNGDPDCICVSIFFRDISDCACRVCDANDVSMLNSTADSICSGVPNGGFTCPANSSGTKNSTSSVTTTTATIITTTTLSSSSLATQSTTSSTASSSATPGAEGASGPTNSDGGLSTGVKAGIGAAVGVGVLVVIGLIVFFVLRRRVQVTWRSPEKDESVQFLKSEGGKDTNTRKTTPSDHAVTELSSPTTPQSQYAEVPTKQGNSYELNDNANAAIKSGGYRPYAEAPTGFQGNNHELSGQQGQLGPRYAEAYTPYGNSHELSHQGETGARYTEAYTTHGNSHELNGAAYDRSQQQQQQQGNYQNRAELSSANYSR